VEGVRLTIAYDGTDFAGWARQPGQRTVQGTLEDAIEAMAGARCELRGASRTDAGVHASGQVAAFDSPRAIPARGWMLGLDAALPPDVAVTAAETCAVGYAPRFDSVDKTYRYLLVAGEVRDPLLRRTAWWLGPKLARRGATESTARAWLDLAAMRAAAAAMTGTHDFRAFRAADDGRADTERTLSRVAVEERGDPRLLAIEVVGDAFLKNMVRILVGTLVDVGRGRLAPERIPALFGPSAKREDAGPTAPPEGLTLVSIRLGRPARPAP
jgi:tRNA pseudouridine38-40 synthase